MEEIPDLCTSSEAGPNQFTMETVSKHNTRESCWIVIHDQVYDVTKFIEEHPGGEETLLEYAGMDATSDFEHIGHTTEATDMMKVYRIGDIPTKAALRQIVELEKVNGTSSLSFKSDVFNEIVRDIDSETKMSVVVVCGSSSSKNKLVLEAIASYHCNKPITITTPADNIRNRSGLWALSDVLWSHCHPESFALVLMECQAVCDEYTRDEESEAILQLGLLISSSFIFNCPTFIEEEILCKLANLHGLSISKLKCLNMEKYCKEGFTSKGYDSNINSVKFFQGVMFVNMETDHTRSRDSLQIAATRWGQDILSKLNFDDTQREISQNARKLLRESFDYVMALYMIPYRSSCNETSKLYEANVSKRLSSSIQSKMLLGIPLVAQMLGRYMSDLCEAFNPSKGGVKNMEEIKTAVYRIGHSNMKIYIKNIFQQKCKSLLQREDIFEECYPGGTVFIREKTNLLAECKELSYWLDFTLDPRSENVIPDDCTYMLTDVYDIDSIYSETRRIFMEGVVKEACNYGAEIIRSTLCNWNDSELLPGSVIKDKREALKEQIVQYVYCGYLEKRIRIENTYIREIAKKVDAESEGLVQKNESIRLMHKQKFQSRIELVVIQLVDDLCEIINSRQCTTVSDFDKVCHHKEQLYKMHFDENETENIFDCVVAELYPHFVSLIRTAFATLKRKYLASTITRNIVSPTEIYRQLNISNAIPSRSRINLSFAVDVKEIVFPKIVVNFENILNDPFTNKRIILELASLNIFDNLEIDRLLSLSSF